MSRDHSTKRDRSSPLPSTEDVTLEAVQSRKRRRRGDINLYLDIEAAVDGEDVESEEEMYEDAFIDSGDTAQRSSPSQHRLFNEDHSSYREEAENLASHYEDKYAFLPTRQRLTHTLSAASGSDHSNFHISNTQLENSLSLLGGNVVLRAAAAPHVNDPHLFKLILRPEHHGQIKTTELIFNILQHTPNGTSLDISCLDPDLVSVFSTPHDSYKHLYIECRSLTAASSIVSSVQYPPSSMSLVSVEDREVLLLFRLKEESWVRLSDRSLGFVLARDERYPEPSLVVAAPPRLTIPYSTIKTRRLYTISDIIPFIKRSRAKRFYTGDTKGTYVIATKRWAEITFCGPLEVKTIPVGKCVPIEHPNPFELTPFFESNSAWETLLCEMQNIPDFKIDPFVKFDTFSFLTPEMMFELGCHYASDHLQYGDRVRVLHNIDGFTVGMVGTFQSSLGSTATIVFDSTEHEQSLSQYNLALTFEPLDLVEVVFGRHKGLRGMVVMIQEHEVSIVDEKDSTNLVTIFSFCLRIRADGYHAHGLSQVCRIMEDVSRARHHFVVGDQVRIEKGPYKGWNGTIVWVNLNRTYQVCDSLIERHVVDTWRKGYGFWTFDLSDPDPTNSSIIWSVDDNHRKAIAIANSDDMVLITPVTTPGIQMKSDFLVNKRVMVVGAHTFKGMKGFVVSVDLLHGKAQVSLDARTMVSNQTQPIGLQDLMLDMSTVHADVYHEINIGSDSTYIDNSVPPIVHTHDPVPHTRTPTPPLASQAESQQGHSLWQVDNNDNNTPTWAADANPNKHPLWLTEPAVVFMLNSGMRYRVAARSGRNGRTHAWVLPPTDRPVNIPIPNADEVLVKLLPKKKADSIEVKRLSDLITTHPTPNDLNQPVWFITPCQDLRTGTLLAFDTTQSMSSEDLRKYASGGRDAIMKVNAALCTVRTANGVVSNIRNSNLVRISPPRVQ